MAGLSSIFSMAGAPTTMASLSSDSPSRAPPSTSPTKKPTRIERSTQHRSLNSQSRPRRKQQPDKPTIIQIERAIGAGSYRDSETGEMDERKTVLDGLLLGDPTKFEGPVEKKLREVGAALAARTESKFRSSGKTVLMFLFQWILPIWTLSLLVACGVIKLPFSLPFLDDLIM